MLTILIAKLDAAVAMLSVLGPDGGQGEQGAAPPGDSLVIIVDWRAQKQQTDERQSAEHQGCGVRRTHLPCSLKLPADGT